MWWLDLTFIHTPVEPAAVQALLPTDLRVDTWPDADGVEQAWIGLVPFVMKVGLPGGRVIPWVGTFPETNVRTYVVAPTARRACGSARPTFGPTSRPGAGRARRVDRVITARSASASASPTETSPTSSTT